MKAHDIGFCNMIFARDNLTLSLASDMEVDVNLT